MTAPTGDPYLIRVRSEFTEMPGLKLTVAQAARLWALDGGTSREILESLVAAGFLWRSPRGAYLKAA